MRKTLVIIAAVMCGAIIIADYFLDWYWLSVASARLLEGAIVLSCFALVLGIIKLLAYHIRQVRGRSHGSWQSWVILVSLAVVLLTGMFEYSSAEQEWIYLYIVTPLYATLGALLLFYLVNASARLFAWRNGAAVILFISCLVFTLLWIPGISSAFPALGAIRNWFYVVPFGSAMRGLLLGTAVGAALAALRILITADHPFTE